MHTDTNDATERRPVIDRAVYRPGGDQLIPRPPHWAIDDEPFPVRAPVHITSAAAADAVQAERANRADVDFSGVRPSAVLVLLADDDRGEAGVLLTRRSTALRNHPGEISFPGGRIDGDETPTAAALREAHEEVGLDPTLVEVAGELDHLTTVVSKSHIVPVVATAPAQVPLVPTSREVDRVLWVPLTEFVRTDTYRAERWTVPWGERVLYFYELDDETVWGFTAHVLTDLFRRLARRAS